MSYLNLREIFNLRQWQALTLDQQQVMDSATVVINESNEAKDLLRKAGHGVTGTSLLETVNELLETNNPRGESQ